MQNFIVPECSAEGCFAALVYRRTRQAESRQKSTGSGKIGVNKVDEDLQRQIQQKESDRNCTHFDQSLCLLQTGTGTPKNL